LSRQSAVPTLQVAATPIGFVLPEAEPAYRLANRTQHEQCQAEPLQTDM
jgi:hypothetical protein